MLLYGGLKGEWTNSRSSQEKGPGGRGRLETKKEKMYRMRFTLPRGDETGPKGIEKRERKMREGPT